MKTTSIPGHPSSLHSSRLNLHIFEEFWLDGFFADCTRYTHHQVAPQQRACSSASCLVISMAAATLAFSGRCLSVWLLPFTSNEMLCIQSCKVKWDIPQLPQTSYGCGHNRCSDPPHDPVWSACQDGLACLLRQWVICEADTTLFTNRQSII